MATLKKVLSNRQNARRSTGPQTTHGQAIAKMNAISSGLRSVALVIPGERCEDWEAHRNGTIASINPVGGLEAELAERAAQLTWRLRRVVRYETAVMTGEIPDYGSNAAGDETIRILPPPRTREIILKEMERARENANAFATIQEGYRRLQNSPDDQRYTGNDAFTLLIDANFYTPRGRDFRFSVRNDSFLIDIGVPREWVHKPESWDGWTVKVLKKGLAIIARSNAMTVEEVIGQALRKAQKYMEEHAATAKELEGELASLSPGAPIDGPTTSDEEQEEFIPLMDHTALEKVMRYESHLSKQLFLTLELLDRLQANRSRGSSPSPDRQVLPTVATGVIVEPKG
jgi:hypothetical protein